jgi:peptide/nickel transport system substrate-binding protein
MHRRDVLSLAATTLALPRIAASQPAGETLRIAVPTEWFSLDPHFHTFPANLSMAGHVFSALTATDAEDALRPVLAERWEAEGGAAWIFRLRQGVVFSDGTPLTAEDVVATLERIPRVRAPSPLTPLIRSVAGATAPDPLTVRIATRYPDPLLPKLLSAVHVIPRRFTDQTTSERFNSMEMAIGSGPYRYVSWQRGDRLIMERNERFFGERPAFARVEYRVITNGAAREAALLAGDIDVVQSPNTDSIERLAREPNLAVFRAPSSRITYVGLHQGPQPLADMSGTGGRNPFADPRVRRAISLAIPRQAIQERTMAGLSIPTGQIVAPGRDGHEPSILPDPFDPDRARALMVEAGWGDGFEVALTTATDRNVNGTRIAQAIAASLRRINVRINVNAVPLTVQQSTWRAGQQSMFLHGNGPQVEPYVALTNLTHTKRMAEALGTSNESFYSNPELDAVIRASLIEIDDARRIALMRRAALIVRDTVPLVPLHHEVIVVAARRGFSTIARGDERIFAAEIGRG